jgi:hypothetical protein
MHKLKFKKASFMVVIQQLIELAKGLKDNKEYILEVKEYRPKRSKSQNDFCWELCTQIAKKLQLEHITENGRLITKEDIYCDHIERVGTSEFIAIPTKAVPTFKKKWESNGVGWLVKVMESRIPGTTKLQCYYGSSTYNTEEMTILLNSIVEDCKMYGIETNIRLKELLSA